MPFLFSEDEREFELVDVNMATGTLISTNDGAFSQNVMGERVGENHLTLMNNEAKRATNTLLQNTVLKEGVLVHDPVSNSRRSGTQITAPAAPAEAQPKTTSIVVPVESRAPELVSFLSVLQSCGPTIAMFGKHCFSLFNGLFNAHTFVGHYPIFFINIFRFVYNS